MSDLYTFTDGSVDPGVIDAMHGPPTAEVLAALMAGVVRITRRCEILNSDFSTFYPEIDMIDGSISVDATRDERRTIDITLASEDGRVEPGPGGLWYDKLIRPWRGVSWPGGSWEALLGTFMIDTIGDTTRVKRRPRLRPGVIGPVTSNTLRNFLLSVHATGRDLTKRMITSQFGATTTFTAGIPIDLIITAEAGNAGITQVSLPWSPGEAPLLGLDQTFDGGSTRWNAIKTICNGFGYEVFVDVFGALIVRVYQDPATFAPVISFSTGETGNLVDYKQSINDSELYNHVIVRGAGQTNALIYAEAEITDPTSPIFKDQIGDRVFTFPSPTVSTVAEALALANVLLSVHSLESYQVSLDSIVFPWLEAGSVVQFNDDAAPNHGAPDRFWLSDFTIPIALGPMNGNAKRVVGVST